MKAGKYFAALTAIVFATDLRQPLIRPQISHVVLTKMFKDILVQRSPLSIIPPMEFVTEPPPPPIDGRPDDRIPAGTRAT